jgi:hypothetical protein
MRTDWEVKFGISEGCILAVEPRFRGPEVVALTDEQLLGHSDSLRASPSGHRRSHWEPDGPRAVRFWATTCGNPNNVTPATQGICLDVDAGRGRS